MSVWRLFLGLAIGLFCATSPALAIVIKTKDGRVVAGKLKSDDGTRLIISIPTPDGRETDSPPYIRAEIEITHELDVPRLERLSKGNPEEYFKYAKELAGHKDDPEARPTAMRLFLIAANLAPDKLGSDALLRMSELASDNDKATARKCRAMALLLGAKADSELLKTETVKPANKPAQLDKAQEAFLGDFTKALQHYRAGDIIEASKAANKEGVDKIFNMAPDEIKIDKKTFLKWCDDANCQNCTDGTVVCTTCKGKGRIVINFQFVPCPMPTCSKGRVPCPVCGGTHVRDPLPDNVHAVLRCELWALDQQGAGGDVGRRGATQPRSWSTVIQSRQLNRVLPLELDTIIPELEPRKCRYRNSKWGVEE